MTACREIQQLLPVSSEDVSPEEYRRITGHLAECSACRRVQEELSVLERAAAEFKVPEPEQAYWDTFSLRVRQRIGNGPLKEPAWWVRWFVHRPMVGWPATAAAAVVVFFLVRAMLPDGKAPISIFLEQQIPSVTMPEGLAPASTEKAGGTESAAQRAETWPETTEVVPQSTPQEEPITRQWRAEETPAVPSTARPTGKAPEFRPDAIPAEEQRFASAEQGARLPDTGPPARTTVILRGDTVGAEINKGMPEGRELERAERPNAPFPPGDTTTAPEQRALGAPTGEGYRPVTPQTPALNRGEFTAQDREFFTEKIKTLSERLTKEKSEVQRATCRALVDMYYQLAMNWRSPADIEQAIEFMAKARKILPEEDYFDLDAKTAALKSLLDR